VYVRKNDLAPPPDHQIRLWFRNGTIDTAHELVNLGLDSGVLHLKGNWIYFGDLHLGQGILNAARTIRHDSGMAAEIREQVTDRLSRTVETP
jgi:hypothetical protein